MPDKAPGKTANYHVRTLERGLNIIELLNRSNGMTINDVAQQTRLPRPTAFRLLHTLMDEGYVVYAARERQYRLTAQARVLSQGYQHRSWITDIAMPTLDRTALDLAWPVTLSSLDDTDITISYITDQSSQLIMRRVSSGVIIPALTSATGAVFLAFLEAEKADQIRNRAFQLSGSSQTKHAIMAAQLDTRILACRDSGFSVYTAPDAWALSVPIMLQGQLKAALSIRVVLAAEWSTADDARYVDALTAAAKTVEENLSGVQAARLPL